MKNFIICIASVLLASCATDPGSPTNSSKTAPAELVFYRCENDIAFTVRFADDSAVIDSNRGYEVLYRDPKGVTPKPNKYGNRRVSAEFGLGATGKEALLTYPLAPLVVRCSRD